MPWRQLLTPSLAPKTTQILAGLSAAYLAAIGVALLLTRPRLRGVVGEGTVTAMRRLVSFIWLPVAAAIYLLGWLDRQALFAFLDYDGEMIPLSLPTLVGIVVFGAAIGLVMPRPTQSYLPWPLQWAARIALASTVVGTLMSLDALLRPGRTAWMGVFTPEIFAASTLLGVEVLYLLTVLESLRADASDLRSIGGHSLASRLLGAARLGLRLLVFVLPVLVGLWLATGSGPMAASSRFVDRHGNLLYDHFPVGQYRIPVPGEAISPWLRLAVDAIEDPGVETAPETHAPINPIRVAGIFYAAVRSAGGSVDDPLSGGSGIGSQTCKNMSGRPVVNAVTRAMNRTVWVPYLTQITTVAEKVVFEFACGWAFERGSRVLHPDRSPVPYYLNLVEFGRQAHGVEAASRTYFGKDARSLNLSEAALLVGLLQAPGVLDPWDHPARATLRRDRVLANMHLRGYISSDEFDQARREPLGVLPEPNYALSLKNDFHNFALDWLHERGYRLSTSGTTVVVTIEPERQRALAEDVARIVETLGPRGINNGAAIVVNPRTAEILAWVGGLHPKHTPDALPDMAYRFPHQPGSSLKPLVYACALEMGVLRPDEALDDTPRVVGGRPINNWDLASLGRLPGREALARSRNVPAAELAARMTPRGLADCLHQTFGLRGDLPVDDLGVELALGLVDLTLLDVASAVATLANGGESIQPTPVIRVQDRDGQVDYRAPLSSGERVLQSETAAWVTDALILSSHLAGLPPNVATKTGSTASSSYVVGYTSDLVLVAWVGRTAPGQGPLAIDVTGAEGARAIWEAHVRRGLVYR